MAAGDEVVAPPDARERHASMLRSARDMARNGTEKGLPPAVVADVIRAALPTVTPTPAGRRQRRQDHGSDGPAAAVPHALPPPPGTTLSGTDSVYRDSATDPHRPRSGVRQLLRAFVIHVPPMIDSGVKDPTGDRHIKRRNARSEAALRAEDAGRRVEADGGDPVSLALTASGSERSRSIARRLRPPAHQRHRVARLHRSGPSRSHPTVGRPCRPG